jgi:predicted 3-demethylubiquinone-9 3-methyltransferase (glyoxalase superfamily)
MEQNSLMIQLMYQSITASSSAENAYQVYKQGFPHSKLKLMQEVHYQHDKEVEAKASKPL